MDDMELAREGKGSEASEGCCVQRRDLLGSLSAMRRSMARKEMAKEARLKPCMNVCMYEWMDV